MIIKKKSLPKAQLIFPHCSHHNGGICTAIHLKGKEDSQSNMQYLYVELYNVVFPQLIAKKTYPVFA